MANRIHSCLACLPVLLAAAALTVGCCGTANRGDSAPAAAGPHHTVTGNSLDLAILGAGAFVLVDDEGQYWLTRRGEFHRDNDGSIVCAEGRRLWPSLQLGDDVLGVEVMLDGSVYGHDNAGQRRALGRIQLACGGTWDAAPAAAPGDEHTRSGEAVRRLGATGDPDGTLRGYTVARVLEHRPPPAR